MSSRQEGLAEHQLTSANWGTCLVTQWPIFGSIRRIPNLDLDYGFPSGRRQVLPLPLSSYTILIKRYTNSEGNITGLVFSPISNFIAFTSSDGSFSRWTDPIPSNLTSPTASDAVQARTLDKLLDDEFGDEDDLNIEERGEDIADDWIVDDEGDGEYARDDVDYSRGRREGGESFATSMRGIC